MLLTETGSLPPHLQVPPWDANQLEQQVQKQVRHWQPDSFSILARVNLSKSYVLHDI